MCVCACLWTHTHTQENICIYISLYFFAGATVWVKLVFPRSFLLFAVGHSPHLGTTLVLLSAHCFVLCFVKSPFFRSGHTFCLSVPYHQKWPHSLSVCPISPEDIWVIKSRMWLLAIDNSQFLVLMSLLLGCPKFYSRLNNSYQDRSKKITFMA